MEAVVKRVHIAVRVFRRALVARAVGHVELAYDAVQAFLFGLAIFQIPVGNGIVVRMQGGMSLKTAQKGRSYAT